MGQGKQSDSENEDLVILGCGYIGRFFLEKHPKVYFTNRHNNSSFSKNKKEIYFDLNDRSSWKNVPETKNVLWTFSAASNENDISKSFDFFNNYLKNRCVIVLSSTSAYLPSVNNELIDEDSPILFQEPRFYAEEKLRQNGALILHLSGIIGPGRTPLNWYQKNLVSSGKTVLNYIHVFDIVYFIEKLFKSFKQSERFNLTSQDYKNHNEIKLELIKMGLLNTSYEFTEKLDTRKSKKIRCLKILKFLGENHYEFKQYPKDVEK